MANYPQSVSVEAIDVQHADYTTYIDAWNQLELLHAGGVRLKNQAQMFLMRRPKEMVDVYMERGKRFVYQDILGTIVGWYVAKLYEREPRIDIETGDEFYEKFLKDCDRSGGTFVDADRDHFINQLLYGRSYALIDLPRVESEIASRADEIEAGIEPYLTIWDPRTVINWQTDEDGNFNWIVMKSVRQVQDEPLSKPRTESYWHIFDRQQYYTYRYIQAADDAVLSDKRTDQKAIATLIDSGPHALSASNRVPVRCLSVPDTLWLGNRAYLQLWDHLDTENTYSWKLFMANLPLLVLKGEPNMTGMSVSESAWLHLKDEKASIEWLEPDGSSFEEARQRLQYLREEIYRCFYLQAQGRSSSATGSAASGYSKELDMAPSADVLNMFGARHRADMQLLLSDVALVRGDAEFKADIGWQKFDDKPTMAAISVAQAVQDLGIENPVFERELDKRVISAALDDANEETKAAALKLVDESPSRSEKKTAEQQMQQQAFAKSFQREDVRGILNSESDSVAA
jgi:hypothetical protein